MRTLIANVRETNERLETLEDANRTLRDENARLRDMRESVVAEVSRDLGDEASAGPMADRAQKIFGGHMGDPKGPLAITGTPTQCVDAIGKHIDLGCTMFLMEFFGRDTEAPAQLFAEEVAPHFRAASAI